MSGDKVFDRTSYATQFLIFIIIFILGFSFGVLALYTATPQKEVASGQKQEIGITGMVFSPVSPEKPSPFDWIKEDQIHVYQDKVVIDLKNAEWATFTDTNSMDPVIDLGANAIERIPASEDEIHVGDIVSYKSSYASGTIIHRVSEIGTDDNGWYFRAKGDNNDDEDPEKIRFPQIQRVVVAVIY